MTDFVTSFAAEYKGFMRANNITNMQIAEHLGRNDGYVSERANGKRPLDTADIDALAALVPGWDGHRLMIELARRAELALSGQRIQDEQSAGYALAASDDPDWEARQEQDEYDA